MRTRMSVAALAAGLFVVGSLGIAGCGGGGSDIDTTTGMVSGHRMRTRQMTIGDVEVKVEPRQMNGRGARFKVTMDTHSGSLDMNLRRSRLMVDGVEWPMKGWTGDGPSGHHREGELRFGAGGPVDGNSALTMTGLEQPVRMRWAMTPGGATTDAEG